MPRPKPKPVRRSQPSGAELAAFAARLATRTGRWLARARGDGTMIVRRTKGLGDPVTALDLEAERKLHAGITRAWPRHGFLGEETGGSGLDREFVWIVDPIDGTANFAADLTPWGVSIACIARGAPIAAAVFCMPGARTMVACAHGGARCNGRALVLRSGARLGADSLVGVQWFRGETVVPFLPRILATGARIRVQGSTVTQFCDVAAGRLDANVQAQGRIWDIAAAALVVDEAGGAVTDWAGRRIFPVASLDARMHYPSVCGALSIVRQTARLLRGVQVLPVPVA